MIDPKKITKFNRTQSELEEFWMFCICVAGKNSDVQAKKLNKLINSMKDYKGENIKPLSSYIKDNWVFRRRLKVFKIGQYKRIHNAFMASKNLNLKTCSLEDLEAIPGIGPKTARMFLLHSRPRQNYLPLDTHICKYLRDNGISKARVGLRGEVYKEVEKQGIALLKKQFPKKGMAWIDLNLWKKIRNEN